MAEPAMMPSSVIVRDAATAPPPPQASLIGHAHGIRPLDRRSARTGPTGILLDRDGTIIVDHGYVGSIDRVDLIDGSAEAIAAFNRAGIPVAVISNQSGVARGLYSAEDVDRVHHHLAQRLDEHGAHVDLFLFCPYHPDGSVERFARHSQDRKPAPGMALAAAKALGLDLTSSWVVGDRTEDMELALAIGATGVLVGDGNPLDGAAYSFPDLASAAPFILEAIHTRRAGGVPPRIPRPVRTAPSRFPRQAFAYAAPYWRAYLSELHRAAATIDPGQVERAATLLLDVYLRGGVVFACGNGGSAAIANHLQCDHSKNVRTGTDLRPRVVSLSANVELLMAIANDIGYDEVFAYQLQSQARPNDVLIAISSSGRSPNILRAMSWAADHGMRTILLTGFDGGGARELADVVIWADSANYGLVEDIHQTTMHVLAQFIRQARMHVDSVAGETF